jgi:hypothetical protein
VASLAFVAIDARCPLCGASVLSVSPAGRVLAEDVHAIPLGRRGGGGGYTLCDDCGVLAHIPSDLTLN